MVLNGWNVIYRVKFDGDNQNLQDDFDTRAEAMEYAKSHLEEKPVVLGIEVYVDEFGDITDEETPEVLYSYTEEEIEEEIPEPSPDRLSELEAELHEEKEESSDHDNPVEEVSEPSEVAAAVDEEEPAVEVIEDDPYDFVGEVTVDETPCVDPFACDFSDVSKDEAMYSDVVDGTLDPTVFLQELANELGIGDEVIIKPADEEEIPEVARVELVDNHYEECPECEGTDKTFDCDFCDFEEPKTELVVSAEVPAEVADTVTPDTPVTVAVAPEAEQAIASEEPVAVDAPCEGENCDPHCEVEEPAKEISKCHVCPTCGKEICECGAKELTEETEVSMETVIDEALEHFAEAAEPTEIEDPNSVEKALSEFVDSLDESASTEELTEDSEMEKHKAIADRFRASLEVEESLEEAVDIQKLSYNRAEDIATKENKPVIYGVSEKGKFSEIAPVICNDIKTDTAKVKANYADVTVYVAYPGKDFAESLEEDPQSDDVLEFAEYEKEQELKKEMEADIEEEMSDLELAERLEAAKKEKHSKNKN